MSRGRRIDDILQPLTRQSHQYFLGNGLHTLGHPARSAFFHGVAITAREVREDIRDAARAGSPFSVSECLSMIERQLSSVTMI